MATDNPYVTPPIQGGHSRKGWQQFVVGLLAMAFVLAVAAFAGSIAPTVAHLAGAPREFTVALMRVSMSVCIPFGMLLAYLASRYARRKATVASILWLFSAFLVVIPLGLFPSTRGPLIEYTGVALLLIILSAMCSGLVLRRLINPFEPNARTE
jgi:hypothetical protein